MRQLPEHGRGQVVSAVQIFGFWFLVGFLVSAVCMESQRNSFRREILDPLPADSRTFVTIIIVVALTMMWPITLLLTLRRSLWPRQK